MIYPFECEETRRMLSKTQAIFPGMIELPQDQGGMPIFMHGVLQTSDIYMI